MIKENQRNSRSFKCHEVVPSRRFGLFYRPVIVLWIGPYGPLGGAFAIVCEGIDGDLLFFSEQIGAYFSLRAEVCSDFCGSRWTESRFFGVVRPILQCRAHLVEQVTRSPHTEPVRVSK